MATAEQGSLERRGTLHRALGDERRLAIVDALRLSDRTPSELATVAGVESNLLAFHLGILEGVGVIERSASQGDGRRRYVRLVADPLTMLAAAPEAATGVVAERVLFVCTANSARSQLAAALWRQRTGRRSASAGTHPDADVHPLARETGQRHGLTVADPPRGYDEVPFEPDLVVSVCDRAFECGPPPFQAPILHWSVPDPAAGDLDDFERVYAQITQRVERLAAATCP